MINIEKIFLPQNAPLKDIEEINNSIECGYSISGIAFAAKMAETGKTIGYINVELLISKRLQISYLAIHKEHPKSGLGKKLFAQAIELARDENCSSVTLSCRVNKVGDFYRKQAKCLDLTLEEGPGGHYPDGEIASDFTFSLEKKASSLNLFSKFYTF